MMSRAAKSRDAPGSQLRTAVTALALLTGAAAVVRRLRIAVGMRRGDPAVIDAKRARNNRFANRLINTVGRAGRPHSIFSRIRVTGRRTGRAYATPVRAVPFDDGFLIPLTYGPHTSWYLNLRANPGELDWHGRSIAVGNPAHVATATVAQHFPLPSRFLLWLDGTDSCVHLRTMTDTPAPDG